MENFNKIEAYFENRLGENEKQDFLKEIESNPELKSEFEFQQQVIEGIKEARKAELKAMLNNVPIASVGTSTSVLFKIIASSVTALIIGSGIYWYYTNSNASQSVLKNQVTVDSTLKEDPENSKGIQKENGLAEEETSDVFKQTEGDEKPSTQNSKANTTPKVKTPELPSTDDNFSNQTLPEENLDVPETISQASVNLNSKVDVEIRMKKKYNFHYQFISGKLILYGDFEDEPFEVLEVNGANDREMYLYYKSNYYYIKDMTGTISPLEAVKEPSILQKLKKLR